MNEEDIADAIERRKCREEKKGKRGEAAKAETETEALTQIKKLLTEMNYRLEKIETHLAK